MIYSSSTSKYNDENTWLLNGNIGGDTIVGWIEADSDLINISQFGSNNDNNGNYN